MDVRKIFLITLFGFFVYLPNATAQFVLPVFSGYWYYHADDTSYTADNCGQKHLDDKNSISCSSMEAHCSSTPGLCTGDSAK